VQAIGRVEQLAADLKNGMDALGSQANAIGDIIGVISDIADQTNLLALNAAIEAARAGEAGRGFAVVADEVRKLAEKTMSATKEVETSIVSIQRGAAENVNKVAEAFTAVESATSLAHESGGALNQIVSLVDQTTRQIESIAAAASEESRAAALVNTAVEEIRRVSGEIVESTRASSQAVLELNDQSANLHDVIRSLRS